MRKALLSSVSVAGDQGQSLELIVVERRHGTGTRWEPFPLLREARLSET